MSTQPPVEQALSLVRDEVLSLMRDESGLDKIFARLPWHCELTAMYELLQHEIKHGGVKKPDDAQRILLMIASLAARQLALTRMDQTHDFKEKP